MNKIKFSKVIKKTKVTNDEILITRKDFQELKRLFKKLDVISVIVYKGEEIK